MTEEPRFLDDESLLENLDEDKAKRVLDWLILVHKKAPQDLNHAIYLSKEINNFYSEKEDDYKTGFLFKIESDTLCSFYGSEVHDPDIFEKIMTQLEEKYV